MLRDYQQDVVSRARTAFKSGARGVVINIPTGTGKGSIAEHVSTTAAANGKRTVISAPRREIVLDIAGRVRKAGHDPGIIAPWAPFEPEKLIQVASDKTLPRRLDLIDPPDLFIPDECHHTVAAGYGPIFDRWKQTRTLGLTATLWRLDGRGFENVFDELITSHQPRWFVDNGYLVDCDIYCPSIPDLAAAGNGRGDYTSVDIEAALEKSGVVGDAIRSFSKYVRPGGTAVAFCASKKHAEATADAFNAAGIPAETLLGEDDGDVRNGKLERLDAGVIRVLCTVDVVSEGFDLPSIDAAILLRPTKSLSLYIQQVGRVLRPVFAAGFDLMTSAGRIASIAASLKTRAIVLDHSGNALRHGHPLGNRAWSIVGEGTEARAAAKTEAGEDISVRQCPTCFGIHMTAPVCPYCGFQHPVDGRVPRWKAGELRKLEADELEDQRKANRAAQGQAKTHAELVEQFRKEGSPNPHGRAWHVMKHRKSKARR